ncbi:hemoglobin/transferrin/lactoferrin receptor protein [Novosphingobium sp. CF614]|uniref:TonB-dependent hemoglobin/transferrin/lactoferrin family receptor n=1 Tax=Novosphingobium sp. CF614 TaxID=1884364 RepID=UPI0008EB5E0B|nr:TonB-dependent hemoglobin/transferrin/lactoferrin family receptor [Novosphingobium sp. CF614]SFG01256.1 hemoglobin/transferrin/lactoferrin receptor protein [Novosphingobium sp. CF614]
MNDNRSLSRGGRAVDLLMGLSGAALAFAPTSASAQDGDPLVFADARNTITVTATRIPQSILDVPATVSVIDDARIADELVSDIKDLVRFEPGVSVRRAPTRFGAAQGTTGRDGNAGFNIRGIEGNRVLIQVDGIRVPDEFSFGAQAAGRGDYVDLGLVKSVEILRGPASALYGSDGLAGAVSFITSDPADFLGKDGRMAGLARAAYDSADNEFSESAILAGRSGDWSALIAYTRRDGHELDNKGGVDAPNATRTAPNPQDTNSNAALGKIVWMPDGSNRVRLTVDHLDARVGTDVLSGIAAVPSGATSVIGLTARDRTRRDRVSLDWRYQGSGVIDHAQAALWYQDGENRQYTAEDRNTAADRTRLNTFENRVLGAIAEARSDFASGAIAHRLIYGGDISITRQQGLRDGTVPTAPDVFPTRAFPITDYTLAGAYLADEIVFMGGAFTLFPALRFDHYKLDPKADPLLPNFVTAGQSGSRVSPKIGVVLKLDGGTSVFANYAQGFKAPSPSQVNQFFENPTSPFFAYKSIPNPDLRPETSKTFEGGLRFASAHLDATVTGFSGRYRNFISQEQISGTGTVADPIIFQFINLARVKTKGVEGKLEGRAASGITANVAISYTRGDVVGASGTTLPLLSVDPLKLVAGIGYRQRQGRFGGQIVMTHSMGKEASRTAGQCTPSCYRPDGFTILDATAFVRVGEAFALRAGIFNLLDKKYAWWSDVRGLAATPANLAVADAYTQPGRNASVSLTARF